eukprot:CAMPEP_0206136110 /NCGR_PEP_ID=MMETSP1473-20131121/1347_1 /ASSEMBLY_ACC=CAM_ASM_001109 /TAXON_ID=1461547 /ORGANISM="Stichococcus sp, Strain RCC1054" /LENGTH=74 /DNA_ID=CAMNT_0053528391 /DNA_START=554 /DNA_END=778 /DNA_ORIENTATION=+
MPIFARLGANLIRAATASTAAAMSGKATWDSDAISCSRRPTASTTAARHNSTCPCSVCVLAPADAASDASATSA